MFRGGCDACDGPGDYSGSRVTTADEGRGWRSMSCTLERAYGDSKVDEVEVLRLRVCHLSNAGCRSSQGEDRWTIPICRRGVLQMQGAWLKQEQFRACPKVPRLSQSSRRRGVFGIFGVSEAVRRDIGQASEDLGGAWV